MRYQSGVLYIWLKPDGGSWQSITAYDDWDTPEPQRWYAGLYAELPRTTTTAELTTDATHKVEAVDTSLFPSSGYIRLDDENIYYPSKTSTQYGAGENGSIIRGVRSTRISHPTGSNVHVTDCRVEFSEFAIYEINRAMSIAEACKFLVTSSGIGCDVVQSVVATGGASGVYTVFRAMVGSSGKLHWCFQSFLLDKQHRNTNQWHRAKGNNYHRFSL